MYLAWAIGLHPQGGGKPQKREQKRFNERLPHPWWGQARRVGASPTPTIDGLRGLIRRMGGMGALLESVLRWCEWGEWPGLLPLAAARGEWPGPPPHRATTRVAPTITGIRLAVEQGTQYNGSLRKVGRERWV